MKKVLFGLALCVSLVVCCFGFAKATLAWTDITGTLTGTEVLDMIQTSDGSIYAAGDASEGNIAKVWRYSNGAWTDITSGLNGSMVRCLMESSDGSIYAGGVYNGLQARVWKYVGGVWTDITGDLNGYEVNSLVLAADGTIYAGGEYMDGSYTYYARIWRYSTNNIWTDITGNMVGTDVTSILLTADGSIYVSGDYYDAEYNAHARVWRYTGSGWTDVSGNLTGGSVASLIQIGDGTIYAGGNYASGSTLTAKVWKYADNLWQDLLVPTIGTSSHVDQLAFLGNIIYASGYDDSTGAHRAKIWTYNTWSSDVLGEAAVHTAAWTVMLGSDGIYAGGYVNSVVKVWKRAYTTEEQRIIEENKLVDGDTVTLIPALNGQTISGQELEIYFKDLPNKLTKDNKYWMKWVKYTKYPVKYKKPKKNAIKKYWKLTTNLNKFKAKKSKRFKIKVTFNYSDSEFKALKKKNKKAREKNLILKYRTKSSNWHPLTNLWNTAKIKHSLKNNNFTVSYFTKFPKNSYYFGIGLK